MNTNINTTAEMTFEAFFNEVMTAPIPAASEAKTIVGTASNGAPVIIAETQTIDLTAAPVLTEQIFDDMDAIKAEAKASHEQYEAEIAALVESFREKNGLNVEVLGSWIWVTGNTYENREALKAAGFLFSAKKKAWYRKPEGGKARRRGYFKSYEEVKEYWEKKETAAL